MLEIDLELDSVLARDRRGHSFTGKNRRVIFEAFLLAHRAMTALDDRARMQQLAERCNDRRAHPVRARGQNLHDQHLVEAIDDHARQPIAVAVEEAVRIGVIADEAPPEFERALQPPRDQFFNCGRFAPCDHPERDRRGRDCSNPCREERPPRHAP